MLLQLQGIFSQYEHAKICERIRRGMLHRLQAGRAHYGQPPYGYVYVPQQDGVPGRMEMHEEEAEVVRQTFHWLVEEGLSTRQITQRLNARQIPTKQDCGCWQQSRVVYLLKNSAYMGTGYFHRYQTVQPTYSHRFAPKRKPHAFRERPQEEWVAVEVPALISVALFQRAQERLAENGRFARRHQRRGYLLSGLLQCAQCGDRLSGKAVRDKRYYYCIGTRAETRHEPKCQHRCVPAEPLEAAVWEKVAALLRQPGLILEHYHQLQHQAKESSVEFQEQQRIQRQLERLGEQRQRLVDAYQNGVIELEELQRRKERIAEREQFLQERKAGIESRLLEVGRQVDLQEGLEAFAHRIRRALENPTFADKQRILRLVIERIEVGEEEIVIRHAIPIPMFPLRTDHLSCRQVHSVNNSVSIRRLLLVCEMVEHFSHNTKQPFYVLQSFFTLNLRLGDAPTLFILFAFVEQSNYTLRQGLKSIPSR